MILESAMLNVKPGRESDFEAAFGEAKAIISAMPGFIGLELQRCIETSNKYLLTYRHQTIFKASIGV